MSSTNSDSFTPSLSIWIPLFFFFYCSVAVARTSHTMLNRSGESEHPCLVPEFDGKASRSSPLSLTFDCGFVVYGFYSVEICTHFGENFHHEWVLNFVNAFSASLR